MEYDFDGFEHQLKEILLQAKSTVHQSNGIIQVSKLLRLTFNKVHLLYQNKIWFPVFHVCIYIFQYWKTK